MATTLEALGIDNVQNSQATTLTLLCDGTADMAFEAADIASNYTACTMHTVNNEVQMGTDGEPLFGKVLSISSETFTENSQSVPEWVNVQVSGVASFVYDTTAPANGARVAVKGNGKVVVAPADADLAEGVNIGHAICLSSDLDESGGSGTCSVFLG